MIIEKFIVRTLFFRCNECNQVIHVGDESVKIELDDYETDQEIYCSSCVPDLIKSIRSDLNEIEDIKEINKKIKKISKMQMINNESN